MERVPQQLDKQERFEAVLREQHRRARQFDDELKDLARHFSENPSKEAQALLFLVPRQMDAWQQEALSRFGFDLENRKKREDFSMETVQDSLELVRLMNHYYTYDRAMERWAALVGKDLSGEQRAIMVCEAFTEACRERPGLAAAGVELIEAGLPDRFKGLLLSTYLTGDFSPNGSQICFYSYGTPKSGLGIYVMDADGSDPTLLYEDPSLGKCDWSPNGTKIAFTVYQEALPEHDEVVYVISADGSDRTALTSNSGAQDVDPAWSPDGTKIAFASDRDGDFDIYTMDADGSNVAQVTTNSGVDDIAPDWQPLPSKSRSLTVHPPDTGGPSLLLVASALFLAVGALLNAGVRRRM